MKATTQIAAKKQDKSGNLVQPKLTINAPGDRYEQEADAMAERVMRMPFEKNSVRPTQGLLASSVQRKCAHCEQEEKQQDEMPLMRKAEGGGFQASPGLAASLNASKGGGSPLPAGTRSFMENAFSADFSRVRVHADGTAAEMSRGIGAKAFTHGSGVYFNQGKYDTHSLEGTRLLAHELTHVLQQTKEHSNSIHDGVQHRSQEQLIQRAMICSKPLEDVPSVFGYRHAYIDDTGQNDCRGAGKERNYAVGRPIVIGDAALGCATKTNKSDDPKGKTPYGKQCIPKNSSTNVSDCLKRAYAAYPQPSFYFNLGGRFINSNTFASVLAHECCANSDDSGLGTVPGWGAQPLDCFPYYTVFNSPLLYGNPVNKLGGAIITVAGEANKLVAEGIVDLNEAASEAIVDAFDFIF